MILKTNLYSTTVLLLCLLGLFPTLTFADLFSPVGDYTDLSCNQIIVDSTIGQTNNYTNDDYSSCTSPSELFDAGDRLYKFVLTDTSTLSIELNSRDSETLDLFLLSNTIDTSSESEMDCPDTCIDRTLAGVPLGITLPPGTYWITVDGAVGPDLLLTEEGVYDLAIRCEKDFLEIECGQIITGSTAGRLNNYAVLDYGGCFESTVNPYGAGEQLFQFEVDKRAMVDIELEKFENQGLHLILLGNAVDITDGSSCPGACIGLSDTGSVNERIRGILPVGIYWLVIDGDDNAGLPDGTPDEGGYKLSISCSRDYDEIFCQQPIVGTTAARVNYSNEADYVGCPTAKIYDGGDRTYQFRLVVADEVTFTLTPTEGSNLDLLLMQSVEVDDDVFEPDVCMAISDTSAQAEKIRISLPAGVYFLVVDGGTVDGVSEEGGFMLSVSCALLPIELVQFSGVPMADGIQLTWETASEINFEGFYIQRSQTGETWTNIDWMDAKGSPDRSTKYSFIDPNPLPGVNYFRLKALDLDGANEYSSIIQIDYNRVGELSVFPSLAREEITVIGVNESTPAKYEIRSALGQLLQRGQINSYQQQINVASLTSGILYLSIVDGSTVKAFTIRKL